MSRQLGRARGTEDPLDRHRRLPRVKNGPRQEGHGRWVVRANDSCVEELARRRVELGPRRLVDHPWSEHGAAPNVDKLTALSSKKPAVRALERL